MHPTSQLLWRNRECLSRDSGALLLLAKADELASKLIAEGVSPDLHTHLRSTQRFFERLDLPSEFSVTPQVSQAPSQIVLFQPREKDLLRLMLHFSQSHLDPTGQLLLVGENREGIKSAGKRLFEHFSDVEKLDSARHCALFSARRPLETGGFELERYFHHFDVEVAGHALSVASLPGVFAHRRIDEGTALLIDALTGIETLTPTGGRVLDFACGSGVIGAALLHKQPDIEVTMSDVSAPALESARKTLSANQLQARVVASDGLGEFVENSLNGRFELIVSNPPFHEGARQQLDVTRRFLNDAPSVLSPSGRLVIVANVHLPYREWLGQRFGGVEKIASNRSFNVWEAVKPN